MDNMKRLFIMVVSILLFMIFSSPLKAQVTIGSGNPPSKGVLLDLKEIDDAPAQSGGTTTNKGLLLPRVKLLNINNLNDIPEADIATPKRYTGLFVYNIDSVNVQKGINVWDGTKWVSAQSQPQPQLRSFLNVKGGGGTIVADISLLGLQNWWRIPFGVEEFDENNEYNNVSTYEFTPKQSGIYSIYAQYKISGVLAAGEYGIGIAKRVSGTNFYTLLAEETTTTINVLGVTVGSPIRSVETLVKLDAGDAITIGIKSSIINLVLVGSTNSYFTVHQVR